jgi:hypothetical protein
VPKVFIGHDPREQRSYDVCVASLYKHSSVDVDVSEVSRPTLGPLYSRPTEKDGCGQLWDVISNAPMATEFSLARFWVPFLADYRGWALFCDCDFMFRADVAELFALADDRYAVMVVKHFYDQQTGIKMDGRLQTVYPRKNWSSLMLFNCGHSSNLALSLERLNNARGKDLHQFDWLQDSDIGQLPINWNWLDLSAKAVHFTAGSPDMPGYENQPYADEWRSYVTARN